MNSEKKVTRRKLVSWLGVLSVFAAAGFTWRPRKAKKQQTIKMLTQDGKLVEIDASLLGKDAPKISNKELQGWINRP